MKANEEYSIEIPHLSYLTSLGNSYTSLNSILFDNKSNNKNPQFIFRFQLTKQHKQFESFSFYFE